MCQLSLVAQSASTVLNAKLEKLSLKPGTCTISQVWWQKFEILVLRKQRQVDP